MSILYSELTIGMNMSVHVFVNMWPSDGTVRLSMLRTLSPLIREEELWLAVILKRFIR